MNSKPRAMHRVRTRLFQSWFRLRRPMTLGVRAIVENHEGAVVLVRHTYVPGLYLPGGGVEKGERAIESLARELREEAGVALSGAARLVGIYANHASFPNDHVVLFRVGAGDWAPASPDNRGEIAQVLWCQPDELPEDVTAGTRRRLMEAYGDAPVSPDW